MHEYLAHDTTSFREFCRMNSEKKTNFNLGWLRATRSVPSIYWTPHPCFYLFLCRFNIFFRVWLLWQLPNYFRWKSHSWLTWNFQKIKWNKIFSLGNRALSICVCSLFGIVELFMENTLNTPCFMHLTFHRFACELWSVLAVKQWTEQCQERKPYKCIRKWFLNLGKFWIR